MSEPRFVCWSRAQRRDGFVALVHAQSEGERTACGISYGAAWDYDIQDDPESGLNFCRRCKRIVGSPRRTRV
jgi:hypothetical protein